MHMINNGSKSSESQAATGLPPPPVVKTTEVIEA